MEALHQKVQKITIKSTHLFTATGVISVIAGGMISAFFAKTPSRFVMWAVAYMVLVSGVVQSGFGLGLQKLLAKKPNKQLIPVAYILYNLGSLGTVLGTYLKYRGEYRQSVIILSGVLMVASILMLCYLVKDVKKSAVLIGYYAMAIIILTGVIVGGLLSSTIQI